MAQSKLAETDLYQPIHDYLTLRGYTVRSEVKDCDVVAVRADELVIIELKCSFNVELLIQATKRQKAGASVYIALPTPATGLNNARWKGIRHLLRRLEIGLILVSFDTVPPSIRIVFHPIPFDRKKLKKEHHAILTEVAGRSVDLNQGGSNRKKIVTAYRENAIQIAAYLQKMGKLSPKQLRALGTGAKTLPILHSNFYGWFDRVGAGVYAINEQGLNALSQFEELRDYYLAELEGKSD